eukprot:jgi/Botrbrau1/8729/Bobra.0090s0005.1
MLRRAQFRANIEILPRAGYPGTEQLFDGLMDIVVHDVGIGCVEIGYNLGLSFVQPPWATGYSQQRSKHIAQRCKKNVSKETLLPPPKHKNFTHSVKIPNISSSSSSYKNYLALIGHPTPKHSKKPVASSHVVLYVTGGKKGLEEE